MYKHAYNAYNPQGKAHNANLLASPPSTITTVRPLPSLPLPLPLPRIILRVITRTDGTGTHLPSPARLWCRGSQGPGEVDKGLGLLEGNVTVNCGWANL